MRISRVSGGQSGGGVWGTGGCRVKTHFLLGVGSKEIVKGTSLRHCLCMSYKLSSNRLHDGYLSARVTQFDDDRRHPTRQKRLLLYPRRFFFFRNRARKSSNPHLF